MNVQGCQSLLVDPDEQDQRHDTEQEDGQDQVAGAAVVGCHGTLITSGVRRMRFTGKTSVFV